MAQPNLGYGQNTMGPPPRGYPQQMMAGQMGATSGMQPQHPHMGGGHPGQPGGGGPMGPGQPQMSPHKELNYVSLVMLAQELVQDTVSRTQEIFQHFRNMQLPNNVSTTVQNYQERRQKLLKEVIPLVQVNFRKIRFIYDKVTENISSLDPSAVEKLLPIEENGEMGPQHLQAREPMKFVVDEYREVCEQTRAKNQQLKEIIDQLRTVIWEINTMIAMRKA